MRSARSPVGGADRSQPPTPPPITTSPLPGRTLTESSCHFGALRVMSSQAIVASFTRPRQMLWAPETKSVT